MAAIREIDTQEQNDVGASLRRLLQDLRLVLEEAGGGGAGKVQAAGKNFRRRFALQREFGQRLRLAQFDAADDILHLVNDRRRGAQFVHAQADQERREHGVAGDLAADAGPDAVGVRGVNGQLDEAQDGRMRRLVKMRHLLVRAVGGERVLDEVVAADAEKFYALRQRVGDERGGWNFNHRADFQVFVKRNFFRAQFVFAFFDERVGLLQFFEAGNHRIHHFHVALGAGAEDGAELGAEHFRLCEAEPDSAPAEKRIHLLRQLQMRGKLVAAQIERADANLVHGDADNAVDPRPPS